MVLTIGQILRNQRIGSCYGKKRVPVSEVLAQEMLQNAEQGVAYADRHLGIRLAYAESSLSVVEAFLGNMARRLDERSKELVNQQVWVWGFYLGRYFGPSE